MLRLESFHPGYIAVTAMTKTNGTSESIFLHHYISYMTNQRLQGELQSNSKN